MAQLIVVQQQDSIMEQNAQTVLLNVVAVMRLDVLLVLVMMINAAQLENIMMVQVVYLVALNVLHVMLKDV